MKILITGGAGFIGSALIRYLIDKTDTTVINVDKLTYAGELSTLSAISNNINYFFEQVDICDAEAMQRIFKHYKPDAVMHLAAESHVDRSIDKPIDFMQTNVLGTYTLLETAKKYWQSLSAEKQPLFRFHHISTDEVFGSLGKSGLFREDSPYKPNSPYAASKASSDHLVRAWHKTYGFPVVITNCSNNYGPYQFPEKLIPLMTLNALEGKPLPIYGKGDQVRDWLFVDDHVKALWLVLNKGRIGETYNIGGNNEKTNLEVVNTICSFLTKLESNLPSNIKNYKDLIIHVADRPGHDTRYAIDSTKIQTELGWKPEESFDSGLEKCVKWIINNRKWYSYIQTQKSYQRERLGKLEKVVSE